MIVALFDADGTLYSAHFGRGLMKYARAHGRRLQPIAYFGSLLPDLILARLGLANPEVFDRHTIARLLWLVRGCDESHALQAFQWVTDEYLLPTQRPEVVARLREHQAQGHLIVIASATFVPSLEVLGQRLAVSDLVGTGVEIADGRYTGRVLPPVVKGLDKLAQLQDHLGDRLRDIDWDASFAYGDSYSDRFMLERVGHPVAVHPDDQLRGLASTNGWEILEAHGHSPAQVARK
jgi:HAD superfamily hydrolase (TIGR01490 family)